MIDPEIAALLAPAESRQLPPSRFGVDDLVHGGSAARRRRRVSIAATVSVVAVAVAVAGVGIAGWRPAVSHTPAGAQQQRAQDEARSELEFLLTQLPLPAGTHPARPVGGMPSAEPAPGGNPLHLLRWYATSASPEAGAQWLMDHSWSAPFGAGSSTTTANGWVVDFDTLGQPNGAASPWPVVRFTLKPRGSGSAIRVDAWLSPRAEVVRRADTLLAPDIDHLAVGGGTYDDKGAYHSRLSIDLSGQRVRALVRALNARPATVADRQCTGNHPTTLAFRSDGHDVVFTSLAFCGSMSVTVDGKSRPPIAAFDIALQQAIAALPGHAFR